MEEQKERLLTNTRDFLAGRQAEHALLWGSRGTGKSSLVKAVFNSRVQEGLRIIELMREDAYSLPQLAAAIEEENYKFIIFFDELVFQTDNPAYRALRVFLQGSIGLPPPNMVLYATSNLRYILPQNISDNAEVLMRDMDPYYGEKTEDSLALADRFGLWLSFYAPSKENYLNKIERALAQEAVDKNYDMARIREAALDFARMRATRNYRTAEQFIRFVRREGLPKP